MSKSQYLTKSRFKIGCECPTKLFYQDDNTYENSKVDDSFLKALAEGGFQVGELAKLYLAGGTEITNRNKDEAAAETAELLKKDNVIIYEACFKFENLFVKTDIVVKKGNFVELIEVKSKSYKGEETSFYNAKQTALSGEWEPYIIDIAYQAYVFKKAYPKLKYTCALMLPNKTVVSSVDGLNQKFLLKKDANGHSYAVAQPGLTRADLGDEILIKVNTDEAVKMAWSEKYENNLGFEEFVQSLSDIVKNKTFVKPTVAAKCKDCEFVSKTPGLKSGFEECWKKSANLKDADFKKNFVFEIWDHRQKQKLIDDGLIFIEQISEDDIKPAPSKDKSGLSRTERQWLQIEKVQKKDNLAFIDKAGLKSEFASWIYPLHFIDFETTRVAIPFNKGRRPYEQYAFQFSHHVVSKAGDIIHQDEYINMEKGKFPNFDFVRALKKSLSTDQGTIFRYAAHENTVLCEIRGQLKKSNEADKDELIKFIESITKPSKDSKEKWGGKREMVDLLELVKQYYYHPMTKGSNSIKAVLPAVLNGSEFLQNKYAKPIYGSEGGIVSRNFKNKCWIEKKDGAVVNPYKLLPPLFSDLDLETMDSLITEDSIADGGAAMTAYARMQFTEMSEAETARVAKALLHYCELDTFAMVMIYEHWKSEVF
jgi:hypothetical protein